MKYSKTIQAVIFASLLSAPFAHAQRGSANGPVQEGAFNPPGGMTEVPEKELLEVESGCYKELFAKMMSPFLSSSSKRADGDLLVGESHYSDAVEIYFNKPSTPYENWLYEQQYCGVSVPIPDKDDEQWLIFGVYCDELKDELKDKQYHYKALTHLDGPVVARLSRRGLPTISYNSFEHEGYETHTNAAIGRMSFATDLKKAWFGDDVPQDPTDITVLNFDHSPSNFYINGTKFFQCVKDGISSKPSISSSR